jgi:hypothetical protein
MVIPGQLRGIADFHVFDTRGNVMIIFTMYELHRIFEIFEDVEAALASFVPDSP